jgi:hypothetical protein
MKTLYLNFTKAFVMKTLLLSCAFFATSYGVLVARTSIALVEHRNTITQTEDMSRSIAEIEGTVMAQSGSIDLAYAKSVGLVAPVTQQFITRMDTVSIR